jgi:hypothetical protein
LQLIFTWAINYKGVCLCPTDLFVPHGTRIWKEKYMNAKSRYLAAGDWHGRPTPEWIAKELFKLLPNGAAAVQLLLVTAQLVEILGKLTPGFTFTEQEQAAAAERAFRRAIEAVDERLCYDGKPAGKALRAMFALSDDPAVQGAPWRTRLAFAAESHNIQPDSFRRRYRDKYVLGHGGHSVRNGQASSSANAYQ